jgi:hypothetical protein
VPTVRKRDLAASLASTRSGAGQTVQRLRELLDQKENVRLSGAEKARLERAIYPQALAAAGETDSPSNRSSAANDDARFLRRGGHTDTGAVMALTRGMRTCEF